MVMKKIMAEKVLAVRCGAVDRTGDGAKRRSA
jgi:hypothetical protein